MILVFDLETSGLHPDNACVWDFACVAAKDGEIVSHFHSKVQPVLKHFTKAHRDTVQRVSGLSEGELLELLDAPDVKTVRASFYDWAWEVAKPIGLATSYNREFDLRFLEDENWNILLSYAPCIMNAVTERLGRRVNLETACRELGVELGTCNCTQHRALPDALLAAQLAIKLGMG